MSTLNIVTNNKPRPLYAAYEIDPKIVAEWFDYITGDELYTNRLFKYRGSWYDLYEFENSGDDLKRYGYDGIQPNSYFDCIAVRYFDKDGYEYDNEIVVAHMHW